MDWQYALQFAAQAHEGQTRDEGAPYFEHVRRVSERMAEIEGAPGRYAVIAALHDILEDTPHTETELTARFGREVSQGVALLTKRKSDPGYSLEGYLTAIAAHPDPLIAAIKLLDRINNVRSLAVCPNPEKKVRYLRQTAAIFVPVFGRMHRGHAVYQKLLQELKQLAGE